MEEPCLSEGDELIHLYSDEGPMKSFLIITDEAHLGKNHQGGVQVCTHEYIELLKATGASLHLLPIQTDRRIWRRIWRRFQWDYFDRYQPSNFLPIFERTVEACSPTHIILNQVSLLSFIPIIRNAFPGRFKYVLLSHGNESGDFLHQIVRADDYNPFRQLKDRLRLGAMLCHESHTFSQCADLVLTLSETDFQVNRWLGAQGGMVIPRTFQPEDVGWNPELGRVGFVGTLDHQPNYVGLVSVLEALKNFGPLNICVRVVGGPDVYGKLLASTYSFVEYLGRLDDASLKQEAATWALFIHPIFWYARGASTKLASPINWGIPVITTTAGLRGYQWDCGSLHVRDSSQGFAEAITELAHNPSALHQASEEIRKVARSGPTLADLASRLNNLL